MFENTADLAENKLLLLYIIKIIKTPISNASLTEIVLENSLMNYFTLQQYISELEEAEFIHYISKNDKKFLTITEKGDSVLSFFANRISKSKKELLDTQICVKVDSIKKELTTQSDYVPIKNHNFLVELKAFEGDDTLMNLKISVPTKKQAISLCKKWQDSSAKIYQDIINVLLKDDTKGKS